MCLRGEEHRCHFVQLRPRWRRHWQSVCLARRLVLLAHTMRVLLCAHPDHRGNLWLTTLLAYLLCCVAVLSTALQLCMQLYPPSGTCSLFFKWKAKPPCSRRGTRVCTWCAMCCTPCFRGKRLAAWSRRCAGSSLRDFCCNMWRGSTLGSSLWSHTLGLCRNLRSLMCLCNFSLCQMQTTLCHVWLLPVPVLPHCCPSCLWTTAYFARDHIVARPCSLWHAGSGARQCRSSSSFKSSVHGCAIQGAMLSTLTSPTVADYLHACRSRSAMNPCRRNVQTPSNVHTIALWSGWGCSRFLVKTLEISHFPSPSGRRVLPAAWLRFSRYSAHCSL
mmetsp:Transcript_23753/g.54861  ORF Transcript_23753/g.54861 Transcript_23753/m.54861 type:complete len:331 (-) Transcript_23753:3094-4086(-)